MNMSENTAEKRTAIFGALTGAMIGLLYLGSVLDLGEKASYEAVAATAQALEQPHIADAELARLPRVVVESSVRIDIDDGPYCSAVVWQRPEGAFIITAGHCIEAIAASNGISLSRPQLGNSTQKAATSERYMGYAGTNADNTDVGVIFLPRERFFDLRDDNFEVDLDFTLPSSLDGISYPSASDEGAGYITYYGAKLDVLETLFREATLLTNQAVVSEWGSFGGSGSGLFDHESVKLSLIMVGGTHLKRSYSAVTLEPMRQVIDDLARQGAPISEETLHLFEK